jgi:hypothetical protein
MWFAYIWFGLALLVFAVAIVAKLIDWHHYRKYGVWEELQRTDYKPRRPAAK